MMPGVAVDYVGLGVRVKFAHSESNGSRYIRVADCVSNELERT